MKMSLIKILSIGALALSTEANTLSLADQNSLLSTPVAPIQITIKDMNGVTRTMRLGGSEGHGGDFKEMAISNLAWDVFAALKKNPNIVGTVLESLESSISNLEVEIVDELAIDDLKRDAINIPSLVKIYLTNEGYDFLTDESIAFKERAQFLLHEMLPIMGSDDSDYKTSEFLANALAVKEEVTGNLYEVLYSTHFDDYHGGLRFSDASDICESVKKSYADRFFAVYCTYQERVNYPYYSHYSSRRYHRRYRRFRSHSYVYGLKVIGLGPVNSLRDRFLINGSTADIPTYGSRAEAIYECTKIVAVQDDIDFRYYRARCEALKVIGGYKFSIITKNPLID